MTGYERDHVVGHTVTDLKFWLEPQERAEMIQQIAKHSGVARFETKDRTRSGDIRLAEISAELVELDGTPCVLAITHDITEGKRLEEQFRQPQKWEAVGGVAGGRAQAFTKRRG